ncbi:MAG: putative N-glycosidase [Myxococcaceae bacterium]|nr:putative N-glycosidase [Myxococcaceae bacterium]
MRWIYWAMGSAMLAAAGCDDAATPAMDAAATDLGVDVPALTDLGVDGGTPDAPDASAFRPGPYGLGPRELAGPFTVSTQDGPWVFEEHFTGEDSYVFVVVNASSYSTTLLAGSVGALLEQSPRNVHYFFLPANGATQLAALRGRVDEDLAALGDDDRAHWSARLHFVTDDLATATSWLGQLYRARRATTNMVPRYESVQWAVDRFQRIREVGQLGRLAASGLRLELPLLANEAKYYNFEYAREQDLAAHPATTVTLLDRATVVDSVDIDATLPDRAAMAGFDTLEVDLRTDCLNHRDGDCGAWDYLSHLWLCAEVAPDADAGASDDAPDAGPALRCDVELARWITSYWREGRWVTDISGVLPLLREGGRQRLRWYASRQFDPRPAPYVASLALRFGNRARPVRPFETRPLFQGGTLNATWGERHPAQRFTVPADARRAELYVLVTGHGSETSQCAEFCNHGHHFVLNGHEHLVDFPEARSPDGCNERVDQGVVPNQHGTWYFGRGGWCPGWDVRPVVIDVTSELRAGAENELTYTATVDNHGLGASAGYGNIVLSSYLVLSR